MARSTLTVMPFGKYKGVPLTELDDDYITWLQSTELRNPLKESLLAEVARRQTGTGPEGVSGVLETEWPSPAARAPAPRAAAPNRRQAALRRLADALDQAARAARDLADCP